MVNLQIDLPIYCRSCGKQLYQSFMQRDNEYTRFRCGCGSDIEIEDDLLMIIYIIEKARASESETLIQLIEEVFGAEDNN